MTLKQLPDGNMLIDEWIYSCEECPYVGWHEEGGCFYMPNGDPGYPPDVAEHCEHPLIEHYGRNIDDDYRISIGDYRNTCPLYLLSGEAISIIQEYDFHYRSVKPDIVIRHKRVIRNCADCPYCEIVFADHISKSEWDEQSKDRTLKQCNHYDNEYYDNEGHGKSKVEIPSDKCVPAECPMRG